MRDREQSLADSLLPACGPPPTGSGLPIKTEQNGPQVAREVREATDRVLDALRHVGTCLGSPPGWPRPRQSIACECLAGRAPLPTLQVSLAQRVAGRPCRHIQSGGRAAATWCSAAPPGARSAVSGPSCTAAWKARRCGPGNSPSGRRGTVMGREAQTLVMCWFE